MRNYDHFAFPLLIPTINDNPLGVRRQSTIDNRWDVRRRAATGGKKVIGFLKSNMPRGGSGDMLRGSGATVTYFIYRPSSWKGELSIKDVTGAKLVEWKKDAVGREAAIRRTLSLDARQANHFQEAICHHVGFSAGCLADEIGGRPARAADALTILGAIVDASLDVSTAHSHDVLPSAAKGEPSEHPDENVTSTLGNLAKQFVNDGALTHALDVCAEWLGVASAETGRANAFEAYCNLRKRHGSELPPIVDLPRKARGHWKPSMLSGSEVFTRLAQNLSQPGVLPLLEKVDLAEQPQLEGAVLEILFRAADDQVPRKLQVLSLQNCCGLAPGETPPAISCCTLLHTLNCSNCNRTGEFFCAALSASVVPVIPINALHFRASFKWTVCPFMPTRKVRSQWQPAPGPKHADWLPCMHHGEPKGRKRNRCPQQGSRG